MFILLFPGYFGYVSISNLAIIPLYILAMVAIMDSDVPVPTVMAAALIRKNEADKGMDTTIFDDDSTFLNADLCIASLVSPVSDIATALS